MGGCFLGCFLNSKRRKKSNSGSPRRKIDGGNVICVDQVVCVPEKGTIFVPESSEKCVERQLSLNKQKRVTFDSNVETFEHVPSYGSTDSLVESNNVGDDERKNEDAIGNSSESITFCVGDSTSSDVGSYPRNNRYQNCGDSDDEAIDCDYEGSVVGDVDDDYYTKSDDEGMLCEEVWSEAIPTASLESRKNMSLTGVDLQEVNSPVVSSGFPENVLSPVENLDEWKAVNAKGSQLMKAREKENLAEGGEAPRISYSSESLESRKNMSLTGVDLREVNSPVVYSGFPENVLSPVENLDEWKAVNAKGSQLMKAREKENLAEDGEAPRISYSSESKIKESLTSCKPSTHHQAENQNNDTGVDSSLSNWLVSSETKTEAVAKTENSMSQGSPSVRNIEDRPILGAWTNEEVKLFSASPSPRKSPRRNPDDMPIIGTVGTYWKHGNEVEDCSSATSCMKKNSCSHTSSKGIPNTTSKYREDKKVHWRSTPFEKRLEKALESGGAEA